MFREKWGHGMQKQALETIHPVESSLDFTLTYTSSTQSALLSHPGSPEHLGMKTGSVSMPDPAHRTCCHTWGPVLTQGTECIVPFFSGL